MTFQHLRDASAAAETAASHLVTRIPRATAETLVSAVIQSFRGKQFDCADTVFVTDSESRLVGIVRINDLFAHGDRQIGEIMEPEHEAARYRAGQEEIAVLAMRIFY